MLYVYHGIAHIQHNITIDLNTSREKKACDLGWWPPPVAVWPPVPHGLLGAHINSLLSCALVGRRIAGVRPVYRRRNAAVC
jgi:hypothetical protein